MTNMEFDTTKADSSSRPVLTAGTVFRDGASVTLLSRDRLSTLEGGELIDKLTAKAARTLIRSFGFRPFRDRDGYQLNLDAAAAAMVHQLASERQARSMIAPTANCRLCRRLALTTSAAVVEEYKKKGRETRVANNVHNVHTYTTYTRTHVHNVHTFTTYKVVRPLELLRKPT